MKKQFILPEKWCIQGCEELGIYIRSLKKFNRIIHPNGNITNCFYYCNGDIKDIQKWKYTLGNILNKTEITFEQFKKYVLKMEQKKIIGYKAPYDLFSGQIKKGEIFIKNNMHSYSTEKYKSMHVPKEIVETWEAVYEPEKPKEEIISMGSFDLKVTKEGIFHKSENIKEFVKYISSVRHNSNFGFHSKAGGYDLIVKDIVLSKTGCENTETTVSQWLKVWDKYQEFQK